MILRIITAKLISTSPLALPEETSMASGIEAIAIRNLREILSRKGFTAENLFSKFDIDGDGKLSRREFETALSSVTGQVAPEAIVSAIFGALDGDNSGSLELTELLSIVDSGTNYSINVGDSISIQGHTREDFNGVYFHHSELINGKPHYRSDNGKILYFYDSNTGSAPSWNLDDREQDGSNDWYRGGWVRAPSDGSPPLGIRRWVGIGKLNLIPSSQSDGSSTIQMPEKIVEQNQSSELSDLIQDIEMATKYYEEQVSEGKLPVEDAMAMADRAFESKIQDLPIYLRTPARKVWEQKMSLLQDRLSSGLNESAAVGAGLAAVGAAGVVTSNMLEISDNLSPSIQTPPPPSNPAPQPPPPSTPAPIPSPPPPSTIPSPQSNKLESDAEDGVEFIPQEVTRDSPDEPLPSNEGEGLDLAAMAFSFEETRMISERSALKDSYSGNNHTLEIRINSVERTFGIGLPDTHRGGNTIIAELEGGQEIEIRLPTDYEFEEFKPGYEAEMTASFSDWNAVRKRLVFSLD